MATAKTAVNLFSFPGEKMLNLTVRYLPSFPGRVCLRRLSPKPMRRLKSCPEIVPVQAITPRPSFDRLELLYMSPRELPIAKRDAPRITGLRSKLIDTN